MRLSIRKSYTTKVGAIVAKSAVLMVGYLAQMEWDTLSLKRTLAGFLNGKIGFEQLVGPAYVDHLLLAIFTRDFVQVV